MDAERQKIGVSADRVERSAKLVRHGREELALRETRQLGRGDASRLVDGALIGGAARAEVAGHFRESDHLTRCVLQCRDDDARPESRAVFPDAPALVFDTADANGFLQLAFRLTSG